MQSLSLKKTWDILQYYLLWFISAGNKSRVYFKNSYIDTTSVTPSKTTSYRLLLTQNQQWGRMGSIDPILRQHFLISKCPCTTKTRGIAQPCNPSFSLRHVLWSCTNNLHNTFQRAVFLVSSLIRMYIRIVFFPIGDALEKVPTQILKRIEYRESLVYYILLDARLYARSNQEERRRRRIVKFTCFRTITYSKWYLVLSITFTASVI